VRLDATAEQFPSGRNYDDRSHEGARTICLAFPAGARAPLLLLNDEDLGLSSAALALPATTRFADCPRQAGTVRLEYLQHTYDLSTPPAAIRRRLGPPFSREGDTLTWQVRWQNPTPDPRYPGILFMGSTGVRLVQRAGRLVYLEVWWLETT
jgi:hypothetical protein